MPKMMWQHGSFKCWCKKSDFQKIYHGRLISLCPDLLSRLRRLQNQNRIYILARFCHFTERRVQVSSDNRNQTCYLSTVIVNVEPTKAGHCVPTQFIYTIWCSFDHFFQNSFWCTSCHVSLTWLIILFKQIASTSIYIRHHSHSADQAILYSPKK